MTHSVSRGAFYLALEKAAALVSGTLYFALVLRWLGPNKYGIITLATSFTGLATMATLNFEMYLERFAADYEARGLLLTLRRAHRMALQLKLGLGVLAGGVILALAPLLARQFATPELATLLPLLAITVVFDGLSTTGRATLYGIQQYRWVSLLAILFHIAKTALVGMLWWARQGLPQLAVGLAILTVAQGVAQCAVPWWMLRHARDRVPAEGVANRPMFRGMVGYCMPLLGARVTFMSGQNLGKIVLGKLFDMAQLGYFSAAFQIVERFIELLGTLPSALLPSLTQLVARGERARLRVGFDQSARLIQVVACATSFLLFAFAREITLVIGSPLFEPTWRILRVLALVPIVRTAQSPLIMLFQAMRLPGTVLRLAVVKFVTEFSGYFLIVPKLGILGAGWANLMGATMAYTVAMVILNRRMPDGAGGRVRTAATAITLTLALIGTVLLIERFTGGLTALLLRVGLVPAGLAILFALGLVHRDDLDKVAAVPLRGWMRRVRNALVAALGMFVRDIEPKGVA
jgi:O-antigen/teichoic acid export membrane protein